jgi:hypothetical protein
MISRNIQFGEALALVQAARPICMPNAAFQGQLLRLEAELGLPPTKNTTSAGELSSFLDDILLRNRGDGIDGDD